MAANTVPETSVPDLHILWINAGLSCDGDSVVAHGCDTTERRGDRAGRFPGLPKVAVHWPLIDFECGPARSATTSWSGSGKADRGELDPFVLVVEGSIPNEDIKAEGYWGGLRQRPADRPADHDERVARSACAEGAGDRRRRHLCDLRRHPRDGRQSDRRMGVADYLGWDWRRRPGSRSSACRAVRSSRTTSRRRIALPALSGDRAGAVIPLDDSPAARRGCSARPCTKAATARATTSRATSRGVRLARSAW